MPTGPKDQKRPAAEAAQYRKTRLAPPAAWSQGAKTEG